MRLPKEQQTSILLTQLSQELEMLTLWQQCRPNLCEMPVHYLFIMTP